MKNVFASATAAAALLLSAGTAAADLPGASFGATFTAQRFLDAQVVGDAYTDELARAYQERAAYEASYGVDGDGNWYDATAFVAKGMAAANGEEVGPWDPTELGLGAIELMAARQVTIDTAAKYKDARPKACARMVAFYDHFIEEVREERHSITSPSKMLDGWKASYADCIGLRSIYGYAVSACQPTDRDSRIPDEPSKNRNERSNAMRIAADLGDAGRLGALTAIGAKITVAGNASSSGSEARNVKLAECRATWVKDVLVGAGVPAELITMVANGEENLEKETGDGVEEYLNRRTDITLE